MDVQHFLELTFSMYSDTVSVFTIVFDHVFADWKWRDLLQISLLILSQFKRINQLLFPLIMSENHR